VGRLRRPSLPREPLGSAGGWLRFERLEQSSVALVSRANGFESQTICAKANALEVVPVNRAPVARSAPAVSSPHCHTELSGPRPAEIATSASCATRLTALLMPDARPSSDEVTLDKTEVASRASNFAVLPSTHAYGGTRVGDNRETNVVNRWGFSHDVPNPGILGASVMGTSGAHNPTPTAQALAWRTAEHLATNWASIIK
jgi:choline dehydrogenase-like flavoprotein